MNRLTKINQKGYTHYVVLVTAENMRIASGWYYKEDAEDDKRENAALYQKHAFTVTVWCKRVCLFNRLDPDNNAHWASLSPAAAPTVRHPEEIHQEDSSTMRPAWAGNADGWEN